MHGHTNITPSYAVYFNIIPLTRLGLWLGLFIVSYFNSAQVSHFRRTCYMFRPSRPPWLYLPNTVWWKAHILNILIMKFSPPSYIGYYSVCIVRMIHNTHVHRVGVNAVFPSVARQPSSIALDTIVPNVPDTSQSQGLCPATHLFRLRYNLYSATS
jgi:hypothetical protein